MQNLKNWTAAKQYPAAWNFSDTNVSDHTEVFWEIELADKLWKFVPPFLLVVGLAGNALVVAVLRAMKFKEHVALFFFFVMAFSDSTVLVVGLLRYWLVYTFDVDMRTLSDAGCKVIFFLTYFSMQLSSWTLAAVTVERFVVIRFSLRARSLVTVTRARITMVSILTVLVLVNGYLLFTQHIQDESCGSFEGDDIYFFDENVFIWIDIVVLCILPFVVMLGCNVIIVREMRRNVSRHDKLGPSNGPTKEHNESSKVSSVTLMLLSVNVYFLVTTIPVSVYFILDTFLKSQINSDPSFEAKMELAWTISYLLQYTNYSFNFYLYVARGRRFRAGFLRLCRCTRADAILESRRQTYGDISTSMTSSRRGTITDSVSFGRRSTIAEAFSHFGRGSVTDLQRDKRRTTLSDTNGLKVSNISEDVTGGPIQIVRFNKI